MTPCKERRASLGNWICNFHATLRAVGMVALAGVSGFGGSADALDNPDRTIDTTNTYKNVGIYMFTHGVNNLGLQVGYVADFCSGVLVSPHVFMTAAHCAQWNVQSVAPFLRMVVSFSSDNPTDLSTWIDISQHLVHPSWPGKDCVITEPIEPPPCAPNADYSSVSDIGLAILSRPVPDIAPVTLPEVDALLASAGHVTMVGYGCSADREFKRNYSTATLASVSNYRAFYNPAPASICNGDSGGPSFLEDRVLSIHSAHDGLLNNDARVDISSALDWIKSVIASVEPPPGTQQAVEYYYADWNFYFVTSDAAEIAALDGGAFGGLWRRTGQTFTVWTSPTNGALPTCRFFSVIFAPRSSHFYTDRANECVALKQNPGWQYEAIAFYLQPLNAGFDCPAGTIILYRLFNNGKDGAPNHRFITDEAQVAAMIAEGWSLEGDGPKTAYACVLATAIPGGVVR